MDALAELLDAINAEDEQAVAAWRSQHGDVIGAWRACDDAGVLLAMAYRTVPDSVVVAASVACVRRALVVIDDEASRARCAAMLDVADRWCRGEVDAPQLQQVASDLNGWGSNLERPLLRAQVAQAAACAADAGRAPRAVQMAARALAYAAIEAVRTRQLD